MAVQFEFYETPIAPGKPKKKRYHARVVTFSTVSTEEIIHNIHEKCSLTESDLLAALKEFNNEVGYRLANGERVHLEGLGYFQITLKCPETRNPKDTRAQKVKFKAVKFRADTELKAHLTELKTERSNHRNHSASVSNIEIDGMLFDYFLRNAVITRKKFQELCGLTQTTAGRHIKRLIDEKRLQNINTQYQPIYMPVPGNYGVSDE